MKVKSINEKIHLVVPIYADDEDVITAYVHSAPISRDVFEAHFLLISKTFTALYAEGLGDIAGPRIAYYLLQECAKKMGDPGGAAALLNEIRRLSNVLIRENTGWTQYQFQETVDHQLLGEDDLAAVMNAIVYFIVASAMHQRQQIKTMVVAALRHWSAQTSSLDFMGFVGSFATSKTVTDFPKVAASSVVF